jgi:hypothetical protein
MKRGTQTWASTIAYCAFTFAFFGFSLRSGQVMFILVSGVFAAFGVYYIVLALRESGGAGAYDKDVTLVLELPPTVPGGKLRAKVTVPASAHLLSLRVELRCLRVSAQLATLEELWTAQQVVPLHQGVSHLMLDIPADARPTSMPAALQPEGGEHVRWELKIVGLSGHVHLERSFPIHVADAAHPQKIDLPPAPLHSAPPPAKLPAVQPMAPSVHLRPVKPEPEMLPESLAPVAPPRVRDPSSTWMLIAANLLPIAGVTLWNWQVRDVVYLYWLENIVIGVFCVLRLLTLRPEDGIALLPVKLLMATFFVAHYGAFCYGHGEFLAVLFQGAEHKTTSVGAAVQHFLREHGAQAALAAIVASHGYSFVRNYLGRGENLDAEAGELMGQPYKRIFVTHIFIIVGGFFLMDKNSPVVAMVIFVATKITFDAFFHRREREAVARAKPPGIVTAAAR